MATATLIATELEQFTGTENWYRHGINPRILYTDGARHLAEAAAAYWLLDQIALANFYVQRVKVEEFQIWILKWTKVDRSALLTCGDGNGHTVYFKRVDGVDFPLPSVTLYCENGIIFLPSER